MRSKIGQFASVGLLLALALGALLLRPDADPAAAALARQVADRLGRTAYVVGAPRYAWTWPLRLEIPAIAVAGLGGLDNVVATDGALDAGARFFGRDGRFALRAGVATFAGEGVSARLDPAGLLVVDTTLAGRALRVAGRPARGGIDGLSVDWDGHALAGTARFATDLSAIEIDATGAAPAALRVAGRALPAEAAFEGVLTAVLAGGGSVRAEFRARGDEFDIGHFEFASPGLAASGSARRDAQRVSIDLRIDDVALATLAGLAAEHLAGLADDIDLRLRVGRLTWASGEALGLILVAAREVGRIVVDEFAIRSLGEASLRMRDGLLDLQAPDARRFLAALGAPVERHLGALALRGPVAFDAAGPALRAGPLEVALAGQRFGGDVAWRDGRVGLALTGERVDLDPFLGRPPPAPPVRGPLLTRSQRASAAAAAAPPAPGPGGWSRVPIRLDLVGGMPVDLTLAVRELVLGALTLGDARLSASHDASGADLRELSGSLLGGALRVEGRLWGRGAPRFDLGGTLAGADWARVLAAFGAPPALRGPTTLAGRLASGGATAVDMAAGLSGTLSIDSSGATLEGLDLPGLLAYAAAARTPDLAELGRRIARGGRSGARTVTGTWQIERGRARTADTRLAAPGGALVLAGEIDLANWRLDLVGTLAADGARIVPRLALAGPPDRANVTLSAVPASAAGSPAGSGAPVPAPAVRR